MNKMRKWIGMMTGSFCLLSSSLIADEVVEEPAVIAETPSDAPKQVGKASADASNAAKSSNTAKYVLAASAVVIGVAALILVSRHHGHHHHSHS